MEWDVPEHLYFEKTNDWYASIIIIAGALVALEFLLHNYLIIVLTIIATVAIVLVSARKPEIMHVAIENVGIRAGNVLYPFSSLDGFAVVEHPMEHKILLESTRHMMPLIHIPIPQDADLGEVRQLLLEHLPEKDLRESQIHLLLEKFGF